jgi:GNAT superfamily N-acetyltransferase
MPHPLQVEQIPPSAWIDWWPLVKAMGSDDSAIKAAARFELMAEDPHWCMLGASLDGQRVGYAAIQDLGTHLRHGDTHRMARLHDLYVDEGFRGQGIGRALMDAVIDWAHSRVRYLEWQAGAETSAPFYEHLGYQGKAYPQPDYPTFDLDLRELER